MSQLAHDLIGSAEAADILGWSRAKVKREAGARRLPYEHKLPGQTGAYVFRREAIEAIAANRARVEGACAGSVRHSEFRSPFIPLNESSSR